MAPPYIRSTTVIDLSPSSISSRARTFAIFEALSVIGASTSLTIYLRLIWLASHHHDSKVFPRLPLLFFSISLASGLVFGVLICYTYYEAIMQPADTLSIFYGATWGVGNLTPVLCECANLSRIMMFYPRGRGADPKQARTGWLLLMPSILVKLARLGCVIELCIFLHQVKNGARLATQPHGSDVREGLRPAMWVLALVDAIYSTSVLSYKLWRAGWSTSTSTASRHGSGGKLVRILRGAFFVSVSSALPPTCLCLANTIWYFQAMGAVTVPREILIAIWVWTDLACLQYAFLWPHSQAATLRSSLNKVHHDRALAFDRDVDEDLHGTRLSRGNNKTMERSRCSYKRPCAVVKRQMSDGGNAPIEGAGAAHQQPSTASIVTQGSVSDAAHGTCSMRMCGRGPESDSIHVPHHHHQHQHHSSLPIIDETFRSSPAAHPIKELCRKGSDNSTTSQAPFEVVESEEHQISSIDLPSPDAQTQAEKHPREVLLQPIPPSRVLTPESPSTLHDEHPLGLQRAASSRVNFATRSNDRESGLLHTHSQESPTSAGRSFSRARRGRSDRPGSIQSTASIMLFTETCVVID